MSNKDRFLLIREPALQDEHYIPIRDICRLTLSRCGDIIEIFTYGGAYYYEDNFTDISRYKRWQEILQIINSDENKEQIGFHMDNEHEEAK